MLPTITTTTQTLKPTIMKLTIALIFHQDILMIAILACTMNNHQAQHTQAFLENIPQQQLQVTMIALQTIHSKPLI